MPPLARAGAGNPGSTRRNRSSLREGVGRATLPDGPLRAPFEASTSSARGPSLGRRPRGGKAPESGDGHELIAQAALPEARGAGMEPLQAREESRALQSGEDELQGHRRRLQPEDPEPRACEQPSERRQCEEPQMGPIEDPAIGVASSAPRAGSAAPRGARRWAPTRARVRPVPAPAGASRRPLLPGDARCSSTSPSTMTWNSGSRARDRRAQSSSRGRRGPEPAPGGEIRIALDARRPGSRRRGTRSASAPCAQPTSSSRLPSPGPSEREQPCVACRGVARPSRDSDRSAVVGRWRRVARRVATRRPCAAS